MGLVAQIKFTDYETSVALALDAIAASKRLPPRGLIIIKPNLTNADRPPVTTPVAFVKAIYKYCRRHSRAEIAIGEGCGKGTTAATFQANGYADLAREYDLQLLDFNTSATVLLRNAQALQLKEFHLPKVLREAFLISAPILKDHSFTLTTIAMKNMFGIAPAPFYRGSWNKSQLHQPCTHRSVVDICSYKKPDLSIADAVVALTGMHLAGQPKKLGLILASFDPVALDAVGSRLLGHDPHQIEYLQLAHGRLGQIA
ncbi:MAG: DUF362 domain-containing protein [Lentisphaerae bacterium]|nr:DUF362 domain-containing protein [Lentisphaerota bacterium]